MRVLGLLLFVACTTGVWAEGTSGSLVYDLSGTTETRAQQYDALSDRFENYFKECYDKAVRDGTTTFTVSDFKRDFMAYWQRALLHASFTADDKPAEFHEKLHQSMSTLPDDPESLYALYAHIYGYENYLNQWTRAELDRVGLEIPENLRLDHLQPMPGFSDITSSTLDDAARERITAEMESHIFRKGQLDSVRNYLRALKLIDEIKFASSKDRDNYLERNRQQLLLFVRPEHKSFAEEVIRKTTDQK